MKKLPPFFPESKRLQKHWWHRFAWVISIFISLCSYYSFLLFLIVGLGLIFQINFNALPNWFQPVMLILTIPIIVPATLLNPLSGMSSSFSNNSVVSYISFMVLILLVSVLPSLIYRLILFVAMGNKWKEKN